MDKVPYTRLRTSRKVSNPDLPTDLVDFYSTNEGVGLESDPDRLIRLCKLNELVRMAWSDLHIFGENQCAGWESFSGVRLGISSFFDDIVYVISSPSCPTGSILAFGTDIIGPGGNGPHAFECSIVLAASFSDWLSHLEQSKWLEYGLMPGDVLQMPKKTREKLYNYYRQLNPGINWDQM